LQQIVLITLDVTTNYVFLWVKKVLGFCCWKVGIIKYAKTMWNRAPCHLPHAVGQVDPTLVVIPIGLQCMLCEESWGPTRSMLVCDYCSKGWHMGCLTPPLVEIPTSDWVSSQCTKYTCFVVLCQGLIQRHRNLLIGIMDDSRMVVIWLNIGHYN
jgi:hypothetical protein